MEESDGDFPTILLKYKDNWYSFFDIEEAKVEAKKKRNIDVVGGLFDNFDVFECTVDKVSYLLRSLLKIDTDIGLDFPQLELNFHPHQYYGKSIHLSLLFSFYQALQRHKGNEDENLPLEIHVTVYNQTFIKRYNMLLNLYKKGGRAEDPIVLSEGEEEEEEINEISNVGKVGSDDEIYPEDYEGEKNSNRGKRSNEVVSLDDDDDEDDDGGEDENEESNASKRTKFSN